MSGAYPARGEIWLANFSPTLGREQAGTRPALVVSADPFNQGPADLVIAIPLTTIDKRIASNIRINPPEGGLKAVSYIKCEDIRSMSKQRFIDRWGSVNGTTMRSVEDWIKVLLSL